MQVELYGSGGSVPAYTLEGGARTLWGDRPPSPRYLGLIRDGARELGLDSEWQRRLAEIEPAPLGTARAADAEG